jgi:hypothetical protein
MKSRQLLSPLICRVRKFPSSVVVNEGFVSVDSQFYNVHHVMLTDAFSRHRAQSLPKLWRNFTYAAMGDNYVFGHANH